MGLGASMLKGLKTPLSVLIARARIVSSQAMTEKTRFKTTITIAHNRANRSKPNGKSGTRQNNLQQDKNWEYTDERTDLPLPKPVGPLKDLFKPVRELFIAGGGGAGRALPSAVQEAEKFGLDLSKVHTVCATSVGSIQALAIVLNIKSKQMAKLLNDMPTDKFQDWNLESATKFFHRWGLCNGKVMPEYFKKLIKKETGLDDPTFRQLNAKCKKTLRIVTSNVSSHKMAIFDHIRTPHQKVAQIVGLACSVPLVFPPQWISNDRGVLEAYTDGGILKNYPWGVGSAPNVPLEQQLGFCFVNKGAAYALNNYEHDTLLDSFWRYLANILTMIVFQDPLSLTDSVKERTVAITLNHNPMNFNATPQQQRLLDEGGKNGVRRLVRQIIKNKAHKNLVKIRDQKNKNNIKNGEEAHANFESISSFLPGYHAQRTSKKPQHETNIRTEVRWLRPKKS